MATKTLKLAAPEFASFYENNPGFDILHHDFFSKEASGTESKKVVKRNKNSDVAIEKLKQYQRVLRIYADEKSAKKLIAAGLDSAHKITAISEHEFINKLAGKLKLSSAVAHEIYRKAEDVKERTHLLCANIRDMASPFYKATLGANTQKEAVDKYAGIPGYTDLFGTLDYCTCAHCRSVLSPAAYFTDLMRLTNQYVTVPNTATIPAKMTFKDRRPDLFDLPLDCENTNHLVPYIKIVNGVIEKKLAVDLGKKDILQYIANTLYPFNAPFNKPLEQIRACLQHCNTSLATVYGIYKAGNVPVMRENLQLSIAQYLQVITPAADPVSLSNNYGLTITATNFAGLDQAVFFAGQTGLLTIENVKNLVYENLIQSEIDQADLLHQFFINSGTSGKNLQLVVNKTNPDKEFLQIENLSLDTLDRMNRFIRLSNALEWNYSDLDCVLQTITPKEINEKAITALSKISFIIKKYAVNVQSVTSFISDMKTTGIGNQKIPADLFDQVYNYPTTFYAKDSGTEHVPYHPVYILNPTYKSEVVNWLPYDNSGSAKPGMSSRIRSRLVAALHISDNDVTALAGRVIKILGLTKNDIPMTVPNMTLFYRFSKLAGLFNLSVSDFLELLDLLNIQQINDLDNFLYVAGIVDWIKESGFNIHEIKFAITGKVNKYVNVVHLEKEIKLMLENLWTQSQNWMVTRGSFNFKDINDHASAGIYTQLLANRMINVFGICLNKDVLFGSVSNQIQLLENSFITNLIDTNASKAVFKALTDHKVLKEGYLAYDFSSQTDLSYLFTGDPLQSDKTGQVSTNLLEIRNLMQLIAAEPASFISKSIDVEQSGKAFTDLVSHQIITANGILPAKVTAQTDLSFLFPKEEKRELMIADVRNKLKGITENIDFIYGTLNTLKKLQFEGTVEQLTGFFNTLTDLMKSLLVLSAISIDVPDVIVLLLTPEDPLAPVSDTILKLLQSIGQNLFVTQKLNLNAAEFESIIIYPACYGIKSITKDFSFSITDLQTISIFKKLQAIFGNSENSLTDFFACPADSPDKCIDGKKSGMLAKITGWKQEQICFLIKTYIPDSQGANSVASIEWLKDAFDQAKLLNADVYFMSGLTVLGQLDASEANWGSYLNYSNSLFDIVNSNSNDADWSQLYDKISAPIWEAERNTLVSYMIWSLSKTIPQLKSPDDLYQFLLIDVEMGGCTETSYVKEGISAVQLYIQRCRMNLEEGIVQLNIREIWWEWMANYRIWEANRKVFLYPENFIDPDLRKNKTPIFKELKDELMQGDINEERVTSIYMNYFDKLCNLGNLVIAGSYFCEVTDPDWGLCSNLWLFGRTADSPYSYFYRRAVYKNNDYYWEPWDKIDISIGGAYLTPVYAMNKLFIFWAEVEELSSSTFEGGNSIENRAVKATIKYSYYNLNQQWVQPQTLKKGVVTYYYPDKGYIASIQGFIGDMNIDLSQENLYWKKPYPVEIAASDASPGQILVLFGDMPNLPGTNKLPPKPDPGITASQTEFNEMLYNSITRAAKATEEGLIGYASMPLGDILSPNLRDDMTNIVLQNYNSIPKSPQPYRGIIDVGNAKLNVVQTNNVIYDNYLGDTVSKTGQSPIPAGKQLDLLANLSKTNSSITMVKNMPGWFTFDNGNETFLSVPNDPGIREIKKIMQVNNNLSSSEYETDLLCTSFTSGNIGFSDLKFKFTRLSTIIPQQLSYKLFAGGINNLLTISSQKSKELPFDRFYPQGVKPGSVIPPDTDLLDFNGAYGPYFWEVFFYIPFMIANSLSENQQFAEAQKWYQYIFNPTTKQTVDSPNPNDRYWGFLPFWGQKPEAIEKVLTDTKQIAVYNNDPFDPDAIAHLRSTSFQKAIMMNYINNLIKWADNLFEQDTWEAIIEATMLYVMAKDLLGDRPKISGTCKEEKIATFQDMLNKYGNDVPEFLIQLENIVKPSNGDTLLSSKPYNDVNSYFCIGENEKFVAYWNTIDDRLFKIRHCMNIYGQERQLALFEPPIDPLSLVKAFASGSSRDVTRVVSSLSPRVPDYRFSSMIGQAKNVTASLIQLGTSLLGSFEKKDAEHLAMIRQTQESTLLNMTLRIKQEQLSQAKTNLKALSENLKSAQNRYDYYTNLISIGLLPSEVLHIQATILANVLNVASSVMKISSSLAHLVPNVGSPFAMTYGGVQVGSSLNAVGSYFDMLAGVSSFVGNLSLTMAGYQRREAEWKFQQKTAEYDINNIKYQLEASQIAQAIAEQEIETQKKQIEQNKEIEIFYRTKFTNEDLYLWMINRLSSLYFQTYKLAFDLALATEKSYQYERNSSSRFIEFGYWDSLKKGLCSGESLQLSLNQLENAYTNEGKRALQIQKSISLLQNDPMQLLNLKTNGVCYLDLNEKLFDLDYPGHYCRQLKSVSITLPVVVGPYQNIKATLTQLSNKIVMKADLNAVNFLLGDENADVPDNTVLRSNWKSNQQIALSTGVNDSGMFQLNFGDERYLPYEGTGAISTWKLEMPKATNPIDFNSISDIIIQLSYEAVAGDEGFKNSVKKLPALSTYYGYQLLNISQQFATDWFAFMNPAESAAEQVLSFEITQNMFRSNLVNFKISDVTLMLQLYPKVTFAGKLPAALVISDQQINYEFDEKKLIAAQPVPATIEKYDGKWKLVVKKSQIPDKLKNAQGFLDIAKVENIGALVSYKGAMNWG